MKIYVVHSSGFDFKNELYTPLKEADFLRGHDVILPHDKAMAPTNSKELIRSCDLLIAEVSYPSIGLGIELGWAENANVKVICLHKTEAKISSSLPLLFANIFTYSSLPEMLEKIKPFIEAKNVFNFAT
jgi:hypothetical protein